MIDLLSVDNMRKSDAHTIAEGTPGAELMMRAARGVFNCCKDWPDEGGRIPCCTARPIAKRSSWPSDLVNCCKEGLTSPVAIVCGSGNNAGDGYALALLLKEDGTDCTVVRTSDRFSDDGKFYHDKCVKAGIDIVSWNGSFGAEELKRYGVIFDCILGTGFLGHLRPEIKEVIEAINDSGAYVVSVDINSGLNGDSGMADVCVRSDLTVSVGGFKPGHFLNMAKDVIKCRVNCDIGIKPVLEPYRLIESTDVAKVLGTRSNYSNKGTYGYMALIGGSTRYSGAIRLAYLANAAMRSGAGVVKVALPSAIVHDVSPHILESTMFPLSCTEDACVSYVPEEIDELISNVKTVAFGMGIGTGNGAAGILEHLISRFSGTLIVDADGLTLLSRMDKEKIRSSACTLVLTPHIKEFSRLTGSDIQDILKDPIGNALRYAGDTGAIVLLKGPSTVISDGSRVYVTDRGCPGMATAGSGDVLSGVVTAICSYVDDKCLATAAAAYINGAAGELAEAANGAISMIAGDTISAIPEAIKNCQR